MVAVQAAYSEHRRQDVVPIPPGVAEYLQAWLSVRATRPVGQARLWPGTWYTVAAKMLRADLQATGIPHELDGRVTDFHALRATYATNLARLGVNLQTAQALMRHSDPKLTARTCTKLGVTDLGQAVAHLDVGLPVSAAEMGQGRRSGAIRYGPRDSFRGVLPGRSWLHLWLHLILAQTGYFSL